MTEFGFFALCLAFGLSAYALVAGLGALWRPAPGLAESGKRALIGVASCLAVAACALWCALLSQDYSVRYVMRNSSSDMPPVFIFTAFWSALEGSHLLWSLLLSLAAACALVTLAKENRRLLPGLVAAFGLLQTFMTLLCVWASAPLTRQFPVGVQGAGMNALLQNPYMAAHPPSLFSGYAALSVPFAYSVAALALGRWTPLWIPVVRRWMLLAWAILTVGIFLGGKWAYVELGWAGYWAWDPVENSSLMPWLAATASVHNLLILDRTRRLARSTLFLCMAGFILTFMGTFITRSGVISSVHSFAESNIGPAYLSYIVLLAGGAAALVSVRGHLLASSDGDERWGLSKETVLLFSNFLFLLLLCIVLVGTLAPLVTEALSGVKISVQQPFFNGLAPWIGLGLLLLLGLGNLLRWRSSVVPDPWAMVVCPAGWALLLAAALSWKKSLDPVSTAGFFLAFWNAGMLVLDCLSKVKALGWNLGAFLGHNRGYLGSWCAHLGFLVAVCGFLGGYRGLEGGTTLRLGEQTSFFGIQLTNGGLAFEKAYNYQLVTARIEASEGGRTAVVRPQRSKYTNSDDWFNEIGVQSSL